LAIKVKGRAKVEAAIALNNCLVCARKLKILLICVCVYESDEAAKNHPRGMRGESVFGLVAGKSWSA